MQIRAPITRLAPTPSGFLHLGNVLNFALVQALAAQTGAQIMLRIDDLDKARVRPEYVTDVFETLRWMEIDWQLGPRSEAEFYQQFIQHLRSRKYEAALQQLAQNNQVFACTCSRSVQLTCQCEALNLPLQTEGTSWKLKSHPYALVTVIHFPDSEQLVALPAAMQNLMVRKRDGLPSYHLASVVDDVQFGITHVVRGADLWESTLGQLHLAERLSQPRFQQIRWLHHPLVLEGADGEKLSKSQGSLAAFHWREKGLTAWEALAAIGWTEERVGELVGKSSG